MKIWTSEHIFHHPWETVVEAAWKKYPNPHNPAVHGIDVLNRAVDNEGRLKSHRLMCTSWGIPGWVAKIIGIQEEALASEHSVVDPNKKTFTLKTKNITLSSVLSVDEELVYSQDPLDPNKTILKQETSVKVQGLPWCGKLEQLMTESMTTNAGKGRQAMEWVIEKLKFEAKELTAGVDSLKKDFEKDAKEIKTEARKISSEAQKYMDSVLPPIENIGVIKP